MYMEIKKYKYVYFILNRETLENLVIIAKIRKLKKIMIEIDLLEKENIKNYIIYFKSEKGILLFARTIFFLANCKDYEQKIVVLNVEEIEKFLLNSEKQIIEFTLNFSKNYTIIGQVNLNEFN